MIGYTCFGTRDLPRAAAFYDDLLANFGARRAMQFPRFILWSAGVGQPAFAVALPYDGQPSCVGNGTMIGLRADSRAMVDAVHAKALELGGSDEGAPGERMDGFYAGYFRDLDGNKLNVHFMG